MKKVLSLILTLGLIMTCFAGVSAFAAADSVYYIDSVEEFNSIKDDLLGTYYVTANIGTEANPVTTSITGGFSGKLIGWDLEKGEEAQRSIYAVISGQGLFATATGAFEISHITLEGSVTGSVTKTGGFIGETSSTTTGTKITDCVNNAIVSNTANVQYVAGFIGYAGSEMLISNCVNNGSVTGKNHAVAGIAAHTQSSKITIENCANFGDIKTTNAAGENIGGIVGYNQAKIDKCFNVGNIEGGHRVGGIVGRQQNTATVSNCFNLGTITSKKATTGEAGGVVCYCYNTATVSNVYNAGAVTGAVTGQVLTSKRAGYEATVENGYYLADATSDAVDGVKALSPVDMTKEESFDFDFEGVDAVWTIDYENTNYKYPNLIANPYVKSIIEDGSSDNPYIIDSPEDFKAIATKGSDKSYKLTKDIVLTDYTPVAEFSGDLIGYDVYGETPEMRTITVDISGQGLFASASGDFKIKNITLIGSVTGNARGVAGFVGTTEGKTLSKGAAISNCVNNASVTNTGNALGTAGFIGYNYPASGAANLTISNCINNAKISAGNGYTGGICGISGGSTISKCANTKDIIAKEGSMVGGIVGFNYATVEKCYNAGNVIAPSSVGGIVGQHKTSKTISDCFNVGTVKATGNGGYAAGIAGSVNAAATISTSYNAGNIIGANSLKIANDITTDKTMNINNCFYLADETDENVMALTDSEMKNLSNFTGFNETGAWEIKTGVNYDYPNLVGLTYVAPQPVSVPNYVQFTSEEGISKAEIREKYADEMENVSNDNYAAIVFFKVVNGNGLKYGVEISKDGTDWGKTKTFTATSDNFPFGVYVYSSNEVANLLVRVFEYNETLDEYKVIGEAQDIVLTKTID